MKKHVLVLLIFAFITPAFGQFQQAQWSEVRKSPEGFVLLSLSEDTNNVSYVLHANREKKPDLFFLEVFNEDMSLKESFEFQLPTVSETPPVYMGARAFSTGFYVFATDITIPEPPRSLHTISAYKIESASVNKEDLTSIPFTEGAAKGDFNIAFSPSGEYYSILSEHPAQEGTNELVTVSVFDQTNTAVFSKELPLDVLYKKNIHNYIFCTNAGSAYIVKKDKEKNVFRYLAYGIQKETTSLVGKVITIPGKHVTDIRATVTDGGLLHVGGFTSTEPLHEYTGYFLFAFDSAFNTIFRTTGSFDNYTLELMLGKKASKDPVMRGFYIDRMMQVSGGTTYLLAEKQEHSKTDKGVDHSYGDVLILVFDQEGKYKKSQAIKKQQSTALSSADFGSYAVWTKADTLYLAYNEVTTDLINKSSKITDKSFLKTHVVITSDQAGVTDNEWIEPLNLTEPIPLAFEPGQVYVNKNKQVLLRFASPDRKYYRLVKMGLK